MKYALVMFRVHLLDSRPFVIYTDHASLRTATNSPHLSQRMARWLSFFAEYNFRVEYRPDKLNVLADALSRRPENEQVHVSRVTTDLYDRIHLAYQGDENYTPLVQFLSDGKDAKVDRLSPRQRAQLHRYELADGPWRSSSGCRTNDEDLKYDILLGAHDVPVSGHLDREKTYQTVSQTFWWHLMYKWVAHYVKTCETCQRVKPSGHASAPQQSLPVPADCWKSMTLDFVFGLPTDDKGNTGILVFVCRLSKMVHLAPAAQLFLDSVFRYHGLPETIVSDRDPRFTGAFWETCSSYRGLC
ncbi:Putative retroelement [Phytophthora palmivora]|uniref:Retroelement n=1 Tax=Phytophthora palmivora TaxID=4796 RepID=A0A2P4XIJ4_9STRA|nr:Putative retroelement [Phytophthora palmivora]